MSSLFSKKGKDKTLSIVFDIRSSSIGGSIIDMSGEIPTILYTTRIFEYFKDSQTSSSFVTTLLKTLDKVILDIKETGLPETKIDDVLSKVKDIYVVYSSPWYVSHTKDVYIDKDKPFKFTKEIFRKIVKEELKSKNSNTKGQTIVEKDITYVNVNGYNLTNPFDKKITNLDISFYISSVADESIDEVEKKIKHNFETVDHINHRTHPLIFFSAMRNIFKNTPNFLFIDIGGEVTDIGLVRNDRLVNIVSMPHGKHYFIRKVMEECETDYASAISSIRTISKKEIDTSCKKKVNKLLPKLEKEWLNMLEQILETFGNKRELPQVIFVSVDKDLKDLFTNILKSNEFSVNSIDINKKTNVFLLDHSTFSDEILVNPGVVDDVFMELIGTFLNQSTK